jgi:FkbM family methyltransferase
MSTIIRQVLLKGLRVLGVKSFRTTSGFGYPFLCHVGDFAGEVPFYNRAHSCSELRVMAAWCARQTNSVIFDVGANVGFIATQLAQAINGRGCRIIAFEPVYETFTKLTESVHRLGLQSKISTVCCAVSDRAGAVCSIASNQRESLFAHVKSDTGKALSETNLTWCSEVTIDSVVESLGIRPLLLKIDVEGYEAHVLRGARALLHEPTPPVISFELNPSTLREAGSSIDAVAAELRDYRIFYIDDFEGQKLPFGEAITDLTALTWTCNLFAVPAGIQPGQIDALFN